MASDTTTAPPSIVKHRLDYRPPAFLVPRIEMVFGLDADATEVTSTLHFTRNPDAHVQDRQAPLTLDGEAQTLLAVALNGAPLDASRYQHDGAGLILHDSPDSGTLTVTGRYAPSQNTALEGLYLSSGIFCTQCEAEGFRRITFFPDRPDVLSRFDVTLRADRRKIPILLSNGNLIESGDLHDGRHFARWQDPFPKPCYLFALVAGDLDVLRDNFVTASGRNITLEIYSTKENIPRCAYAMAALKRAMRWDETRYRREYDLDRFMIFCADDFNSGAMENKGLNIFNSKLILADPATATDDDYHAIESVIAHEYFHNWTGNRVTCRDWFQLSLKEGLTVFRDQQFSSDMGSTAAERIAIVDFLRKRQFPEDAGPTAHPVRPDEYREIRNFYTMTVYEKGAEVIRMQHQLLGEENFQRGMDLYFSRHDGQAVTCDDFVQAMQDASGVNLTQFKCWYSQAGTPEIRASGSFDATTRSYTLTLEQHTAPTPEQPDKAPLAIPVAVGLLDEQGRDLPLELKNELSGELNNASHSSPPLPPSQPSPKGGRSHIPSPTKACTLPCGKSGEFLPSPLGKGWGRGQRWEPTMRVLLLNQARQSFRFENIDACPVPSLLRGGSAPARLYFDYDEAALNHLARHDSDAVNRWDAAQRVLTSALVKLARTQTPEGKIQLPPRLSPSLFQLYSALLTDEAGDPMLRALALTLPDLNALISQHAPFPVEAFVAALRAMRSALADALAEPLIAVIERHAVPPPYQPNAEQMAHRKLRAHALALLCAAGQATLREDACQRAAALYRRADNMTDTITALAALRDVDHPLRAELYDDFEKRWRSNPLVLDKWFALEATALPPPAPFEKGVSPKAARVCTPTSLARVNELIQHPAFSLKNPNRVRAVLGVFAQRNIAAFHAADGSGYRFIAGYIDAIDKLNPQIAAMLLNAFSLWAHLADPQRAHAQQALRELTEKARSPETAELLDKLLS
ncbi:MAG: aminopeptidase N [Burkholderiales bacterium]|jgi:aminopeptidase N|nr:aminopeptidase N [Burkholderiales bacterium]